MSNSDIAKYYSEGRFENSKNPYQGKRKKVLCVCSAGLLRSPTIAHVLAADYTFNTRSCGVGLDYALIPIDPVLLHWADEIVCAEDWHKKHVIREYSEHVKDKLVHALDVPDNYEYRDPNLVKIIKSKLLKVYGEPTHAE